MKGGVRRVTSQMENDIVVKTMSLVAAHKFREIGYVVRDS